MPSSLTSRTKTTRATVALYEVTYDFQFHLNNWNNYVLSNAIARYDNLRCGSTVPTRDL